MTAIAPILCCIPDDTEVRRRMADVVGSYLEVHPGSIPGECNECSCKVWIGPLQQRARRLRPEAVVMCMLCALPEAVLGTPVLALATHLERSQ